MTLTNFIVATTVVIATTLNFGAQGFPRPQLPIRPITRDDARVVVTLDGFALERPASQLRPLPNSPGSRRTTSTVSPTVPTPSPIVTPTPTPTQPPTPSTMRPEVAQCIRNCPTTSEYNPVCGSNRVMYNNPGRLMCAQMCGINVTQIRMGRC